MTDAKHRLFLGQVALPRSATEYVLDALREAIGNGTLKSGTQLVQNDIAASLNVSRMPVREALRILEVEGWVEFSPRRGAVVATLSPSDIRQIFEIRFALEALALRKSVPVLNDEALDRASAILDDMDTEEDIGRWIDLHRKFHLTLYAGAGERIIEAIQSQYNSVERYLRIEVATLDNRQESQDEHREILAVSRKGDVDGAIAILRAHIEEAGQDLSRSLGAGTPGGD